MQLRTLVARNFRVLRSVDLSIDADLIVFSGANGSGKSSLLEAIHLLGTGRSFRTRSVQDVISREEDSLLVRAQVIDSLGRSSSLAVEKLRRGTARFRVADEPVRAASSLARHLPLVLVSADSQRLLSDGADLRRRQLDWLMFHVEPRYQHAHSRYRRALGQRNAMLRAKGSSNKDERAVWSTEMALAGEELHRLRAAQLTVAQPMLEAVLRNLCSVEVQFSYKAGWDTGKSLAGLLQNGWESDAIRGYSALGPHRADLQFQVGGRPAQHVVSRGEGKILVVAVLIGFAQVLAASAQIRPLILIDELASELDGLNRERFLSALRELGMQTFITTVSQRLVDSGGWGRVCRCELSQGEVIQVLQ